ncbi:MAG: hypothetical protein GY862_16315 [Gammaproteobacteria bacterium]|nr:hypothetical protein [Gammaproteobacteria bacterium]
MNLNIETVNLILTVLTTVIIPFLGLVLRSIRNDIAAKNELINEKINRLDVHISTTDEHFHLFQTSMDEHVNSLQTSIHNIELNLLSNYMKKRDIETNIKSDIQDDIKALEGKIDRVLDSTALQWKEFMDRLDACKTEFSHLQHNNP